MIWFGPSSTVYGGIDNIAPMHFRRVKHHVKIPPCGGAPSVVFGEALKEDASPGPVETEASSEVKLHGDGERGTGAWPVRIS